MSTAAATLPDGVQPVEQPDKDEAGYEDYYGVDTIETWYFPDGKQYINFKPMNEGERSHFQRVVNKDVTVERATGDARLKIDPANERTELIMISVVDWHLMRRDNAGKFKPVPFGKEGRGSALNQWYLAADPKLIDKLEQAIRDANPWMLDTQDPDEIQKEIERLEEAKERALVRAKGEDSSSSK